jgi:hypothetical protein
MTRKDYKAIAEAIKNVLELERRDNNGAGGPVENVVGLLSENIAGIMAQDNPRFDRIKFLSACGL